MTKRNNAVLIVLPLLFLAGIAAFLSCSNQGSFTGSCVKNPDAYLLDVEKMNENDLQSIVTQSGIRSV